MDLGARMNCFEWSSQLSDSLDGVLSLQDQQDADAHLRSCLECAERNRHYHVLIETLAAQPRSALPIPIRKSGFRAARRGLDFTPSGKTRWQAIPWYLRTPLEGTGIVLAILLAVSAGPRLRSLYERNLERSLSDFADLRDLLPGTQPSQVAPLERAKSDPSNSKEYLAGGDDFEDLDVPDDSEDFDDSATAPDTTSAKISVGKSEVWRFNIKSDSPKELRGSIIKILTGLSVSQATPGLGRHRGPRRNSI